MNIAQGLKEKNRIAGRIVNLQNMIKKYNRFLSTETQSENFQELWDKLLTEKASLARLKSQIQRANVGIAEELVNLAEAKAMISYLTELESTSGIGGKCDKIYDRKLGDYIASEYTIEYNLDSKGIRNLIEAYQKTVEDLQDKVDNYNATTSLV